MFRPNQTTGPATRRLPKMQKRLGDEDLQFLLSEAASKKGALIEMPFQIAAVSYMLTVKMPFDSYEPVWTYYLGDDAQARMLWQHPTGDTNLILNLCATSSGQNADAGYSASGPSSGLPHLANTNPNVRTLVNIQSPEAQSQTYQSLIVSPPPTNPNISTNPGGKTSSMQGDLSNMQVPTLLQSINMSKMTGRLFIENESTSASIYFDDGMPVHASTAETSGDPAIVEMITWEDGRFHFYPSEKTNERTVKRRVDGLLMEGVTLLDQNKYVREKGLKPQSFLIRVNERLSEEEFRTALTKGAPLDFEKQKKFYSLVDNASTLMDMLRKMPMIKNEWVPLMFNMITCGLIAVSDTPPAGVSVTPVVAVPPFDIDRAGIQAVIRSITRPETGLLSYPAFLYFLEQEFSKCAAMGIPLSLLVLEPKLRVGDSYQALPMNFQKELFKRLEGVKRPFDTLGHFETFEFALFLPATPSQSAKVFTLRLMEMLASDPFIPKLAGQLTLFTGIAAAPEDTQELPVMLSAAREAKNRGREAGQIVTLFREVSQR